MVSFQNKFVDVNDLDYHKVAVTIKYIFLSLWFLEKKIVKIIDEFSVVITTNNKLFEYIQSRSNI